MSEQPNVILIMVDQWRGDCLSIDDHPVVRTPYLDQIALTGARFCHAYSATPTCIAARAALFTGLNQHHHGRVGYQDGIPWNYPVTLAGEFTRHGYQTQAIGKMHVYPERSQMGFQNVILHDGYLHFARRTNRDLEMVDDYLPWLRQHLGRAADFFDHGVNCNSIVARPWDKDEYVHPTNYVITQSIDFLRRRDPRKPFFLFVSFHRPHPPYDPPGWAFEQYVHEPMPDVPVGDWAGIFASHAQPHSPESFVADMDKRLLQRARAGYYGHMTHIDQQINRFMETLAAYGLAEQTYVCFTSDHGEMMGDHHLFRKGYPYEGSARVPLIISGPATSGIKHNSVSGAAVELQDIMPTLLDCAGLPIPDSVDGKSFLPLARGQDSPWRNHIHGEHVLRVGAGAGPQAIHWLTNGHEKYVWFTATGDEQLFDLDNDPQELHDVGRQQNKNSRLAYWRQALIQELAGREEGFSDGTRLIAGRPVRPALSFLPQSL